MPKRYSIVIYVIVLQVVEAVVLGRSTLMKIRQNLIWALGYNAIGIPIAGIPHSYHASCQSILSDLGSI